MSDLYRYYFKDIPYEIMVQPLENIDKFETALAETKIDWNAIACVSSVSPVVEDCFRRLGKRLCIQISIKTEGNRSLKHFLDSSTEKFDIRYVGCGFLSLTCILRDFCLSLMNI